MILYTPKIPGNAGFRVRLFLFRARHDSYPDTGAWSLPPAFARAGSARRSTNI